MKHTITLIIGIAIGIGIGWYLGYIRLTGEYQRELIKEYQPSKDQLDAEIADFHKRSTEAFKEAEPWQASSASMALGALKNFSTNDVEGARITGGDS